MDPIPPHQPEQPLLDPQVVQRKIQQLHAHYVEKQMRETSPYSLLIGGAALVSAVAFVIFSEIVGLQAIMIGGGIAAILSGIGRIFLNLSSCLHMNQKAADAIISPGFYEFASKEPQENLSSAQKIVEAYKRYAKV